MVCVFETMHIIGLTLMFFVVLPELDVVKGAMLTNCVCFIPSVLCELDSDNNLFIVNNSTCFRPCLETSQGKKEIPEGVG